jgi:ubiquinol-cytochrome c reductase cytochrome c subunit
MRRAVPLVAIAALLLPALAVAATGPPTVGVVSAQKGAALYAANCSSCHGPRGAGIEPPGKPGVGDLVSAGPSLQGVGALAADFYVRTGYMPLANPHEEPARSQVLFSETQIRRLVSYVASLGHGPAIPAPDPAKGSAAKGFELFGEHCAGCHQIAAEGGLVTGARVPPLDQATNVQIAEAIRIGPYLMPSFSPRALSDEQVDSLVRYIDYTRHPDDAGGWSIGRIGPVPEGMVAWLVATAALVGACLALSRRARHE